MDFEILSYIKKPNEEISDVRDPTLKEKFINVDNNKLAEIREELDPDYLDGYIFIKYDDKVILNEIQWDLIDDLWAYILHLIEDLLDNNYAETYFPDQPLKISFADKNEYLLLELYNGKRKWLLPKKQFFEELLNAAEFFFHQISRILPKNDYNYELDQIKRLRHRINS